MKQGQETQKTPSNNEGKGETHLDITELFFDDDVLPHQDGLLLLQLEQPHFIL